jgi:FdhD protein
MAEEIGGTDMKSMVASIECDRFSDKGWERTSVYVPSEMELTLYVNQQELVSILCTPIKIEYLVLGFLYAEGIISNIGDVVLMRVCEDDALVDVRLSNPKHEMPTRRTIASGLGGGQIFNTQGKKVDSTLVLTPSQILSPMKQLLAGMGLYQLSGGVHSSALSDTREILVMAEDIGRHNTLDKIQGECLSREISTKDRLLLTTGRISSEMLLKAARMQTPVVVSRHSPTGRAVSLADNLGITLVGRVREGRMFVYSHPERLGLSTN